MNLFLVYTPLHFFISCAIAANNKEKNFIIFVEIPRRQKDYYTNLLNSWQKNPFEGFYVIDIQLQLLKKEIFQQLREICDSKQPNNIYFADDRAVIPQYVMHYCKNVKSLPSKGYLIDDGLYCYVATTKKNFTNNTMKGIIRRIIYGSWYIKPGKNGASQWVDSIVVAFPDHILNYLKIKKCKDLDHSSFHTEAMLDLSHTTLSIYQGLKASLADIDIVITLPTQHDMNRIKNYKHSLYSMLKKIIPHKKVAIKYHPQANGTDKLNLQKKFNINLISDNIPFEIILPALSDKITLLGDISSTLIMTKILKPSATIHAFKMNQSNYYKNYSSFFELLSIPSLSIDEITDRIKLSE